MNGRLFFLVTEDWYFVSHRFPLALAARREGFDVAVITRCGKHSSLIEDAGLRVIPFDMDRRGLNPFGLVHEAFRLARIYRRERPDLVHHIALRPVVVGAIAARLAGVSRVVSAIAGLGFLFADEGRRLAIRSALQWFLPRLLHGGVAIVQNPDDAEMLLRCGTTKRAICVIPGAGVDVDRFVPSIVSEDPPVVMLASRLLWDKGVAEFVSAARLLRGRRARFVLVGKTDPGNPASVDESDVTGWVEGGAVECWGHQEDMAPIIKKAEIFCLPSYREGLPKVLLEAMASGKPCITTDTPGCREAVHDGDNGILVPVKDAAALASAIARLLDDPEQRRRMGERGRERAVAEFSEERVIDATLRVYRERFV